MFNLPENQRVTSLAPSKKSDKGAGQKEMEAIQREKSLTKTGIKQVEGTCSPSRSDRVATRNKTQSNERETLPAKTGAKRVDSYCTPRKEPDKGENQNEIQANQTESSPVKTGAKQADGTCTCASTHNGTDGIAGAKQNHIYKESQQSPTKPCNINRERKQVSNKENGKETGRNADDASTSHANNINVEMNNHISHVPAHQFMDRNPTAHVFEVCRANG